VNYVELRHSDLIFYFLDWPVEICYMSTYRNTIGDVCRVPGRAFAVDCCLQNHFRGWFKHDLQDLPDPSDGVVSRRCAVLYQRIAHDERSSVEPESKGDGMPELRIVGVHGAADVAGIGMVAAD